jgi:PPOX class probable F420-dependent enzyme
VEDQAALLSRTEQSFLAQSRVAHLATADAGAAPHVVPVCFAIAARSLYITLDEKPKRSPTAALRRLRNIRENPVVAVVVDRYDEDWALLGWVMLFGRPVIAVRIERATSWGNLRIDGAD